MTSNLDQAATADQGAIAGAVNNTQNEINSGTVNYNSDLVHKAVTTPTAVTSDPNQLNDFLGQWNAAYTGPSSFETSDQYNTAAAANTDAQQKQAEVTTPGGQQQLLNSQFGVYGQGNQGLDQALLTNSSYDPKLQNEAGNFQNVQNYLTNQATNLDTAAANAQATTDATKTQTQAAFANEPTTFQNQINAETSAAQGTAATAAAKYQSDLAAGDPVAVAQDLTAAGVPADQIATVTGYLKNLKSDYGITPDASSQYNFNPATAITSANATTAQDYANAAAYGQLTGADYSGILNQNNVSQAGTAPTAVSGVNGANISSYLQGQLGTQDTKFLTTPGNMSDIIGGKVSPASSAQFAQQYVDAANRQGVTYANSPNIQKMLSDATSTQSTILGQGAPANDPRILALQPVIDTFSKFAQGATTGGTAATPATPGHPGTPATPGTPIALPTGQPINVAQPNPAGGGSHLTPVSPGTLLKPTPISNFTDKVTQSLNTQLAKNIGGNTGMIQANKMKQDAATLTSLYNQYQSGNINATNYLQLQQLLKQFNIQ